MSQNRRRFIQAFGVGTVGAMAGCSGGGGGEDPEPTETTGDDGSPTTTTSGGSSEPVDTEGPTIIEIEGAGVDIWDTNDLGHYFYQEVSGDFDVRVQVTSIENTSAYAKAGIMIRNEMNTSGKHAYIRRYPNGNASPQWRNKAGSSAASVTSDAGAELARESDGVVEADWLRLERSAGTIRTYASSDGEEWLLLAELPGTVVSFNEDALVGLAVTSHNQAEATTATFRDLEGLDVNKMSGEGLGNPLVKGSVTVKDDIPVVQTVEAGGSSATSATFQGRMDALGGGDSAEVSIDYREVMASEWQSTDTQSVSSTDTFSFEVSGLTARRYYEYRARASVGDQEVTSQSTRLVATKSESGEGDSEGPASASQFDPNDGFVEMAPWLDDNTPLVKITEPERAQLETAFSIDGPRVVVFETSGTIDLEAADISIQTDKCWVAGQTAPSPGITLIRGGCWINASNCVVQHLRIKSGDAGHSPDEEWEPDPLNTTDGVGHNIMDHVTAMWSVDENLGTGYRTQGTTISNCLIAEPLDDSTHHKGPHGYNSLLGNNAKDVAVMGNVYAFATDRNPRMKKGVEGVVVNTLVHFHSDGPWLDPQVVASLEGNAYERPQTEEANIWGDGEVYLDDNIQLDDADVDMVGGNLTRLDERPHWPEGLEKIAASETKEHNLSNAGARPADRSEGDQRVIDNVRNSEGPGVIDSQQEVGGYPELAVNTEELSPPSSGLRAWLREQAVAVEE